MKFIKRLIFAIIVIAVLVLCYRHFKPQIAEFLNNKGVSIPGISDDTDIMPTSETVIDENGRVRVALRVPDTYTADITQEMINQIEINSYGRFEASIMDDGSLYMTVTPAYRDELLSAIGSRLDNAVISTLVGGKVLSVSHNSVYSLFTVVAEPGMSESDILTLTGKLFAIGRVYGSFSEGEDVITVNFISSETSGITNSYSSDNMGEGLVSDAGDFASEVFDQAFGSAMEIEG